MARSPFLLFLLKLCSASVFFGRAYQHIFFDAPYRSLLWDEAFLQPVVEGLFNMEWNAYVTNLAIDGIIQSVIIGMGAFYLICGVLSLIVTKDSSRALKFTVGAGAVSLMFLALLQAKSKFYHLAMFLEHAIQFGSPVALLVYLRTKQKLERYRLFLKGLIALTFISHGLYAIGWPYPLPGNFVTMTMNILPVSEDHAKLLLSIAGSLDFLVAVLIFLPKVQKWALCYAFLWGLLTAFARITSGLSYDFSLVILHQYLFETIYRIPHGLIPLVTYYLVTRALESPHSSAPTTKVRFSSIS